MLLNHLRLTLLQYSTGLKQLPQMLIGLGLAGLLLISSGCQAVSWLNPTLAPQPLNLSILQVEPENSGSYTVSGQTTLPDKTQITVSAVRYLQDKNQTPSSTLTSNYAVLDRQMAEVNQGNWEARLNLWQSSANGQFQEAWQVKLATDQQIKPEPDVTFLATLEPANQPTYLKQQVQALEPSQQVAITRFTTDGELYLQAAKTLAVPPPQGSASTVLKAVNSGSQEKPQVLKPGSSETQQVQQRQIDLPSSPDIFVR